MTRKSLKHIDQPTTLPEALAVIDDLRGQLKAMRESFAPIDAQYGMSSREWLIYCLLRNGGPKTWDALCTIVFGSETMLSPTILNRLKVSICKLRGKLPRGEGVRSVRGVGYQWMKKEGTEAPSPRSAL